MNKRSCLAKMAATALAWGALGAAPVLAQQAATAGYPGTRPIRLVVSQQAGGSSDTVARLWAEHAGKALGANIVVENKPGAGGTRVKSSRAARNAASCASPSSGSSEQTA